MRSSGLNEPHGAAVAWTFGFAMLRVGRKSAHVDREVGLVTSGRRVVYCLCRLYWARVCNA